MNKSTLYTGSVNTYSLESGIVNINVFGYEFDNKGEKTNYCTSGGWLETEYFSKNLIENLYDFFYNERIHSINLNQYKITSNRLRYIKAKTFFKFKSYLFKLEI